MRTGGLVLLAFLIGACATGGGAAAPSFTAGAAGVVPSATSSADPKAAAVSASPSMTSATTTSVPPRASVTATAAQIVSAATARGLDAAGRPVGVTDVFDVASDQRIVLAIGVAGATTATTIGYRRYFEGAFVDGQNTHPTHGGDGTVSFTWQKTAAAYPAGTYLVHLLVDGKPVRSLTFVVR